MISSMNGKSCSHVENNTTILKFFLYISKEEQLARFKERLDDPARQWKISNSDYSERDLWDEYIEAFEAALVAMLDQHAPWFVDSGQSQVVSQPCGIQIVADTLDDMNLKLPKPTVDLNESSPTLPQGCRGAGAREGCGQGRWKIEIPAVLNSPEVSGQ